MAQSDAVYFRAQAKKCRWLAKGLDSKTAATLLKMADEYDARAASLDAPPPKPADQGADKAR